MRKIYFILIALTIAFTSFAQEITWESITLVNADFELPDDDSLYHLFAKDVPGWFADDESYDKGGRTVVDDVTVPPETEPTDTLRMGLIGYKGDANGTHSSGEVYQLLEETLPDKDISYRIKYDFATTFQSNSKMPDSIPYIVSLGVYEIVGTDTNRTYLASDTNACHTMYQDSMRFGEFIIQVDSGSAHAGKKLYVAFWLDSLSFNGSVTKAAWVAIDNITLEKSKEDDPDNINISEIAKANVFVYNSVLNIQLAQEALTSVSVYDLTGKNIFSDTFSKNYTKHMNIAKGIYIVELKNTFGTEVRKIMIQ